MSNLADMKISEDVLPEFRQFSHSFNQMLERLNNAFAAQRQLETLPTSCARRLR